VKVGVHDITVPGLVAAAKNERAVSPRRRTSGACIPGTPKERRNFLMHDVDTKPRLLTSTVDKYKCCQYFSRYIPLELAINQKRFCLLSKF